LSASPIPHVSLAACRGQLGKRTFFNANPSPTLFLFITGRLFSGFPCIFFHRVASLARFSPPLFPPSLRFFVAQTHPLSASCQYIFRPLLLLTITRFTLTPRNPFFRTHSEFGPYFRTISLITSLINDEFTQAPIIRTPFHDQCNNPPHHSVRFAGLFTRLQAQAEKSDTLPYTRKQTYDGLKERWIVTIRMASIKSPVPPQ